MSAEVLLDQEWDGGERIGDAHDLLSCVIHAATTPMLQEDISTATQGCLIYCLMEDSKDIEYYTPLFMYVLCKLDYLYPHKTRDRIQCITECGISVDFKFLLAIESERPSFNAQNNCVVDLR